MSTYILKIMTVTDLHRRTKLLNLLAEAVTQHQPNVLAFGGDVLHSFGLFPNFRRRRNDDCARFLAALPCQEMLFVRGNHEDEHWVSFAEAWRAARPLRTLHGETFTCGPLQMVGFPCLLGHEMPFKENRPSLDADTKTWLPQVMAASGPAARTFWLMHEPPLGTPLSGPFGAVAGNPEWNEAIEQFQPLLCVCGHDHHTPIHRNHWHHRIGKTLVVNVGQTDAGPLHYCVIEAEFSSAAPALPTRLTVTGYPFGNTVEV